jgi:hypothetical protein
MRAGYSFIHGVFAASPTASFMSAMGKIIRNIRLDVNSLLESVFVTRDECAALIRVLSRRTDSAILYRSRNAALPQGVFGD